MDMFIIFITVFEHDVTPIDRLLKLLFYSVIYLGPLALHQF